MIFDGKRTNPLHAIPFLASIHPSSHVWFHSRHQWLAVKLHNCHVTLLTHVALESYQDHEAHLPMKATNPSQIKSSLNSTFSRLSIFVVWLQLVQLAFHKKATNELSDMNTLKMINI